MPRPPARFETCATPAAALRPAPRRAATRLGLAAARLVGACLVGICLFGTCLVGTCLVGAWLGLAPAAWAGALPAVAIAAELSPAPEGGTRLSVVLSRPVEAKAFVMERPDRAIIDLPEVNFQLPLETGRRREGLVASFRYGLFAPGRSRIVIDLAQTATVARVATSSRKRDGATLLTIDLARADRDAFRRAAVAPAPPAAPKAVPASAGDTRPLVIIDAGHGGTDPGAIAANGAFEKDIVFGVARDLARRLEQGGRVRVRMTRESDVFVPLGERVRIARDARADLFISIHADSISAAPQVRGATIYTGSEKATDAESARLADRENKADQAAGADSAEGPGDVADILQELTLRETRGFSARFAQGLLGQLDRVMEMSSKPHREAGFRVLRSPDVPSVLVELGYLSSKHDLDLLLSDAWRAKVTTRMAEAIEAFFAARPAPVPAVVARSSALTTAPVSP
ncbi:N-acetylmuramoyl-L-alanine amidase [Methylobacterium sp. 4-46]|uniref:N-acetylmuramoyl-L-alanine amidase n=1 Tax=unclassified Methylobacterium TaxID=2615210 RepID=UPI000152DF8F|nr:MULTISPECIES: N-acetylmuramoyl-L-alanine amidase [Methylobacterium]ACA20129.1 N-acetylmuramoyl-L-alanine amidase [Methylobacterium sp. 4-46]WFT79309.1 N-acetylmuramoyl-L-alanine amidase [Methylobacterium nodulans]